MITFQQFQDKYNGKPLEYNNDQYHDQCMDEMWGYMSEVLGIDTKPYQGWGTAINLFNCTKYIKDFDVHFTKVFNTLINVPSVGAIIFWKKQWPVTGDAGHVALVTSANVLKFVSFDQNYPTGSYCHLQNHSYLGVVGWFIPKK